MLTRNDLVEEAVCDTRQLLIDKSVPIERAKALKGSKPEADNRPESNDIQGQGGNRIRGEEFSNVL